MDIEPGSFRDPSGFVFLSDGVVYRQVNQSFGPQYKHLMQSGLYAELARHGLLVSHEEVSLRLDEAPAAYAVLQPTRIPFISYPYEWCFGQLKAAALLTLEIQKRALAHDMSLRDASAFNVQFIGTRPVFIDTLSLGRYQEGQPWVAYRQFCTHFLGPLALVAIVDPSLLQLARIHIDGIPLHLIKQLLPLASRFHPGLLIHLHLHAKSSPSGLEQHTHRPPKPGAHRMGKTSMLGLVDSLERTVRKLNWNPSATLWSTYTDHSTYTAEAQNHKQLLVTQWFQRLRAESGPAMVWDLGANTGAYSRIAADGHSSVVSFDLDPAAVERHFRTCVEQSAEGILPLVQDLTNPTAGAGWRNKERQSLEQRGPADVAMALALIHHLVVGGNVPVLAVVEFFRSICRYLIIEFVPKEDPQVQRMLALRTDGLEDYSKKRFEEIFRAHFDILDSSVVSGTIRTLYLMRRRSDENTSGPNQRADDISQA